MVVRLEDLSEEEGGFPEEDKRTESSEESQPLVPQLLDPAEAFYPPFLHHPRPEDRAGEEGRC